MQARRADGDDGTTIGIVAPPRILAQLRRHDSQHASARIVVDIDKDLTGHPLDEIAVIIIH